MKTIVVYKSKTGFTKRYAEWIADELKCDISEYKNISGTSVVRYDLIIFGSRLHAGRIDGLDKIKELIAHNGNSDLIVFATGAMPSAAEDTLEEIWRSNFTEDELNRTPHFYMQGGLDYEKMGMFDRFLMKAFATALRKKRNKTQEEISTEQAIKSSFDASSREYIAPLIQYVNSIIT